MSKSPWTTTKFARLRNKINAYPVARKEETRKEKKHTSGRKEKRGNWPKRRQRRTVPWRRREEKKRLQVAAIQFKGGYPREIFTISTHEIRQRAPSVKSYAVSSHRWHCRRSLLSLLSEGKREPAARFVGDRVDRWRQRQERASERASGFRRGLRTRVSSAPRRLRALRSLWNVIDPFFHFAAIFRRIPNISGCFFICNKFLYSEAVVLSLFNETISVKIIFAIRGLRNLEALILGNLFDKKLLRYGRWNVLKFCTLIVHRNNTVYFL